MSTRAFRRSFEAFSAMALLIAVVLLPSLALAQPTAEGRFGRALKVGESYATAPANPIYFVTPMTVELWARVPGKAASSVLLANEPRNSVTHWELFADKGSGAFGVSFPGYAPKQVKSNTDIADGQWHYLAMVFDGKSVKLSVDAKQVAAADVRKNAPYPDTGPLQFGYFGAPAVSGTLIDEVRISRIARAVDKLPDAPFTPDADTVGLWHFDEDSAEYDKTGFADASLTRNPARLELITADAPEHNGFDNTRGGHTRWSDMDYGPFFSSTLGLPFNKANTTPKAISIRLGKDKKHAIAFDTEMLRVSAGWTGDFIKIWPSREGLASHPDAAGEVQFQTLPGPGWAKPGTNDFTDPRPDKLGPLPREWGHYKGLYVNGDDVVLCYSVGDVSIVESHSTVTRGGATAFVRVLNIAPSRDSLTALVCQLPGNETPPVDRAAMVTLKKNGQVLRVAAHGTAGSLSVKPDGRVLLQVPAHGAESGLHVGAAIYIFTGPEPDPAWFKIFEEAPHRRDLAPLEKDAPARYPDPVVTKGVVAQNEGMDGVPYVLDTLTAPDDNPWKSFLRFTGLDFFKNGDAAVCSISGDVWVVSGIDDKLDHLKWRRYATGLFQPLGLKIVNDEVYVVGRDQITHLKDLNGDGEADFYENFNNDCKVTASNGHAYTTCLETDPDGNFYYIKCGDGTEHGGTVLKISKDGSKSEVFATGVRNSTGLGMSPSGQLTEADNQGEWVPASRIDYVHKGSFLGYEPMAHMRTPPTDPGKPVVWMPQNVDNSSGGQAWVIGDKWGLPAGTMLHTSYGAAALLEVMTENVDGIEQGGVFRFPLRFDTGIMRGRFRPQDGQLYTCGLRGWQTAGVKDGALQRVRYTGKPLHMPAELHVHQNGIRLSFTCPLDRKSAEDVGNWSILQWNYHWTSAYGSAHWSAKDPQRQGYDVMTVKSAKLLPDGKTVFLEVPDLRPVMNMRISANIDAADGTEIKQDVYNTIHALNKDEVGRMKDEKKKDESGTVNKTPAATATSSSSFILQHSSLPRKIVLIAGKKSHGVGAHEYEKGCRLLAHCLETSPNVKNVKCTVVTDGWPTDEKVLDDADTILLFCDGSDQDESRHPLLHDDRLAKLGKLMDRGVGLVVLHYTVFVPTEKGGRQFQDWVGGYFDYDTNGGDLKNRKNWYSQLGESRTTSTPMTADHPIMRGVKPFTTQTEYYWKMRFKDKDPGLTPLLTFDPTKSAAPTRESVVAWCVERPSGHRGFAFTGGHFHSNWQIDSFRRMALNALLWTAHADVPEGGVNSTLPE